MNRHDELGRGGPCPCRRTVYKTMARAERRREAHWFGADGGTCRPNVTNAVQGVCFMRTSGKQDHEGRDALDTGHLPRARHLHQHRLPLPVRRRYAQEFVLCAASTSTTGPLHAANMRQSRTVRKVLGDAADVTGTVNVPVHDLRRTVMTRAELAGIGAHVLRDLSRARNDRDSGPIHSCGRRPVARRTPGWLARRWQQQCRASLARWCRYGARSDTVEPETGDRNVHESEPPVAPLPLTIHPHYPFVLIDLFLEQQWPPLVTLWTIKPESRDQLLAKWCALAKSKYWAWDQCRELHNHLKRIGEKELPEELCNAVRTSRPRNLRSQPEKLPRNLLWHEIALLLEQDGLGRGEAERAIALAVAGEPSRDIDVESVMRKVRRARKRAREVLSNAQAE